MEMTGMYRLKRTVLKHGFDLNNNRFRGKGKNRGNNGSGSSNDDGKGGN